MAGSDPTAGEARAGRWHRFLDHTSELQLEVGAESLAGLLVEAGVALGRLLLGAGGGEARGPWRTLEVRSKDREALLVDWLNELLYLVETACDVPLSIDVAEATDTWLRARVRGVPVARAPSLVKAATHHELVVEETASGFRGEVILDV